MATAVIDNVNKMSKYGLRRKPTYSEIIGMLDDNEKITGVLPNRDATFLKVALKEVFLMVRMLWNN